MNFPVNDKQFSSLFICDSIIFEGISAGILSFGIFGYLFMITGNMNEGLISQIVHLMPGARLSLKNANN